MRAGSFSVLVGYSSLLLKKRLTGGAVCVIEGMVSGLRR